MVSKIVSFGFRHGAPPHGSFVLDVQNLLRNPFHDKKLRKLNGLDPLVQADIHKTPDFDGVYAQLKAAAEKTPAISVYVGCKGGHHRSVYIADRLGRELGVPVEHRDLHKP